MTQPHSTPSSVAIVGAGILGLTLALRLAQAGRQVAIFEASPEAGGLASKATYGGYDWDRFYHVVLLSDLNTRALLKELGLSHRLRFGTSTTGFYTDGRLHGMSNAWEFLKFKPLNLFDKARLAMTISMAGRIRNPAPLEKILAVDWLTKWSGKKVVEKIWLPLLKSKLGDNYQYASAAFIWAIIARLYAARRSGLKQERFGVIDGGYAIVVQALLKRLNDLGVQVHTGMPVASVTSGSDGQQMVASDLGSQAFDEVVLAVAPKFAAAMCPQLPVPEAQRLANVPYQGVICAAMVLKQPLSAYYVTNLTDGNMPFTGVIEMTALMGTEHFGGHSLVYLPLYLAQNAPQWSMSTDQISEQFLIGLETMYPAFDRSQILDLVISKSRQVLPISTLNYSTDVMPPVLTSLPHIHFINGSQIAYGTLNVNETIGLAQNNLESLLSVTHGSNISVPTTTPVDALIGVESTGAVNPNRGDQERNSVAETA